MNKQRILEWARTAGSICAVLAGLWVFAGGRLVNDEFDKMVRLVLGSMPSAPAASAPTPAPAAEPAPSASKPEPPADVSEPVTRPQRDWVDMTDKYVEWFTKIVGSLTALLGVAGLTRSRKESA